ncbi:F-box domain-containing protein [Mycena indigotica]|uniref:F-box domain-containing protein n=1 Tax=Mycena indigotica TaxID=2126181 RepID=A0A8H6RZ59_9AGAR|nr:F-box domain-containing protein [Mycena indigotica]KAF7289275.1 F-box domain-containing protein [Mycena indigotica]
MATETILPRLLLSQLPVEITLEVASKLSLSDALSLLWTCASFYALSGQRSFWIVILTTARDHIPLLCQPYTDFSVYPLDKLRELVYSQLRLEGNWSRSHPQVKRHLPPVKFGEKVEILSTLQGTGLALLHLPDSRKLICWDTETSGQEPVIPAIPTTGRIVGVSAPFGLGNVSYVAVLIMQWHEPYTTERHLITIHHKGKIVTAFTNEFTLSRTPNGHYFESLFLTEDLVGTLLVEESDNQCLLSFTGNKEIMSKPQTSAKMDLPQHIFNERDLTVCFAFRGHLYNLIEDGEVVQIQHVSRKSLSSGRCEETNLFTSKISAEEVLQPFCFILPSNPLYGIAAAFIHFHTAHPKIQLIFVPATIDISNGDDEEDSPLIFAPDCHIVNIEGRPADISLVWMDHSGCNVIFIVATQLTEAAEGLSLKLLLVRYRRETQSSTVHRLALPEDFDGAVAAVSVDETMGAVHLVSAVGTFFTLYYV